MFWPVRSAPRTSIGVSAATADAEAGYFENVRAAGSCRARSGRPGCATSTTSTARVRGAPAVGEALLGRSLAEAFLRSGVQAMLGTFFTVRDSAAADLAAELYGKIAAGHPLRAAVRAGRLALADRPDWGNFLLYGDDELSL